MPIWSKFRAYKSRGKSSQQFSNKSSVKTTSRGRDQRVVRRRNKSSIDTHLTSSITMSTSEISDTQNSILISSGLAKCPTLSGKDNYSEWEEIMRSNLRTSG